MEDQNNGYEFAGPGAKRRRMRLDEVPRALTPKRKTSRPYEAKPKSDKQEAAKRDERDVSAHGLKAKIRRLTLQTESFAEVCDEMKRANYPGSGVMISHVRSEMREIVKLLIAEGLLDERQLERHRLKFQRERKKMK